MNGKQHKIANIYTGIVLSTTTHFAFQNPEMTIASIIGSTMGTIVTPDLDLVVPSNFFSRLPIINFLWMCLWWPYKKAVKHRSWVSHSPFVSTALRIFYMYVWFSVALIFFEFFGITLISHAQVLNFTVQNFEFVFTVIVCWAFQDIVHLFQDFVL